MGDSFDHYVARQLHVPDVGTRAERVVAWLLGNDLIERGLTDAPLEGEGYRPGKRALEVVERPQDHLSTLRTNGVRVVTERTVFYAFSTEEATCPLCAGEIPRATWDDVLSDWYGSDGDGQVRCAGCGADVPLCDLEMDDAWGFSNFGVTFWNWGPLTPGWERALAEVMGLPVVHVCGKL